MSSRSVVRRDDATLLVIDEQTRLAEVMQRREAVVSATERLVRTAALVGMPVVVTRQYPKGLGDTDARVEAAVVDVEAAGRTVVRLDKVAFDCFGDAGFVHGLAKLERRQLLIAGMETHICVTQTALSALRDEFDVHVAADACCSRRAGDHDLALARLRAAGAVVSGSESVMYELVGEAGTDEFRALLAIVKG